MMQYIPGVKTVNELAEEKWTPVVKWKEEVRQLKKGDDTQRLNPLAISSDKDLSLASVQDIKYIYNNIDGTPALVYTIPIDLA